MRKRMEAPPPVSGATLLEVTPSTPGRLRRRSVNSLSNRIASGSLGYEVEGRFTTKTRSQSPAYEPGFRDGRLSDPVLRIKGTTTTTTTSQLADGIRKERVLW